MVRLRMWALWAMFALVLLFTLSGFSQFLMSRRLNRGIAAITCDTVNDSRLKAYWKLDEASGNATDSKGANTLTDNNGVTSAAGKIATCRGFSSALTRYCDIADNADVSGGDVDVTGACWVFLGVALVGGELHGLMSKWPGGGQNEYTLYLNGTTQRYELQVSNDGTASTTLQSTETPEYNAWHFVVWWHDATANTINIQVDNGTVSSASYSSGVFNGTGNFTLGSIGVTGILNGFLDEAALWKGILTSTERTGLYSSGLGCRPL